VVVLMMIVVAIEDVVFGSEKCGRMEIGSLVVFGWRWWRFLLLLDVAQP